MPDTSKRDMLITAALKHKEGILSSRKVARNTLEYKTSRERFIMLHGTDILCFNQTEKQVTLRAGGWFTPTTKDRLNRFLPNTVRVFQYKGLWYVETWEQCTSKCQSVFYEDMKVVKKANGRWYVVKPMDKDIQAMNAIAKIKAIVRKLDIQADVELIYDALVWAGHSNPWLIVEMKLWSSIRSAVRRYLKTKHKLPR